MTVTDERDQTRQGRERNQIKLDEREKSDYTGVIRYVETDGQAVVDNAQNTMADSRTGSSLQHLNSYSVSFYLRSFAFPSQFYISYCFPVNNNLQATDFS